MAAWRAERPPKAGRPAGARFGDGGLGARWPKLTTGRAGGAGRAGAGVGAGVGAAASVGAGAGVGSAGLAVLAAGLAGAAAASLAASLRAASAAALAAAASAWAALAARSAAAACSRAAASLRARSSAAARARSACWRVASSMARRRASCSEADSPPASREVAAGRGAAGASRFGLATSKPCGRWWHGPAPTRRLVSTTTVLVRPWLKLWRTVPVETDPACRGFRLSGARGPVWDGVPAGVCWPSLVLSFSSVIRSLYSGWREIRHRLVQTQKAVRRLPPSGSRTPPAQILVRVLSRLRAPLRGQKRSKSRQSFDLEGPAIGPPALKQDGVYRIFQPKGQTQIVRREGAGDFRGRLLVFREGKQLAPTVGRAVRRLDDPCGLAGSDRGGRL